MFTHQIRLLKLNNHQITTGWDTLAAIGVISLVVIAWTLDSLLNPVIVSTDLNNMATMVAKDLNPDLYPRDNLFSQTELFKLYTPLYRWLLAQAWQIGGAFERGLTLLLPLILGTYLAGMFVLLRRVTQNGWVALFLTVLSAHYHPVTMGAEVWGVGGISEMMSRALFMPVVPWVMLLFLPLLDNPAWRQGAGVGLLLGLSANLHPVSALHLLMALASWLILRHGKSWRGWQTGLVFMATAVLGALPITFTFLGNSGQGLDTTITFADFSRVVAERYPMPFFPPAMAWPLFNLQLARPVLDGLVWFYLVLTGLFIVARLAGLERRRPGLLRWGWLVGGLITVAYAYLLALFNTSFIFGLVFIYVFYRFWRWPCAPLDTWLMGLTGLIVFYAFGGYYLLTWFWRQFELWPLTSLLVEYARFARFIYLPIYLLAGLALAAWLKLLNQHLALSTRLKPKWGALGFIIITLLILFGPLAPLFTGRLPLPTRNLLQPENWVVQSISKPVDAELYAWVQQYTPTDALFYGCFGPETMTYFRRKAQRSISHNWKDLTFAVHNRAILLSAYQRFRELEAACQNFNSAIAAAHSIRADYILVSSTEAASFLSEACFVNDRYAVFSLKPQGCALNQ